MTPLSHQSNKAQPLTLFVAFAASITFLVIGLSLTVPTVRAAVGLVTERFGLVLTGESLEFHITSVEKGQDDPVGLTLGEAQHLAPFEISLPSWMPDRVVQDYILCQPNMQMPTASKGSADKCFVVHRVALNRQESDPVVTLDMAAISYGGGVAVNAAKAVETRVNGLPAIYVKGGYDEKMEWHDDAPTSYLAWTRADAKYVLLGTNISRDDLMRVAESIK